MTANPSHPWLTFEVDLLGAPPLFWLQLGEVHTRCSLLGGAGLAPGAAGGIARRAQARGILALAATGHGALSDAEAESLLAGEPVAAGARRPRARPGAARQPAARLEASRAWHAVAKACDRVQALAGGEPCLSPELLGELNRLALMARPAPAARPASRPATAPAAGGRPAANVATAGPRPTRAAAARAGGRDRPAAGADEDAGAPELDPLLHGQDEPALARALAGLTPVPEAERAALVAQLCEWLNAPRPGLELVIATLKASLAHLYLAWMRPFAAGNALTARLAELHVLLQAGVPLPVALLPAVHYARTREEYARYVAGAAQVRDGARLFLSYAVGGLVDGLRALHAEVEERQRDLAWEAALAEALQDESAAAAARQRALARELANAAGPVPRGRLLESSPSLTAAYAGKSAKTLARDLERLVSAGLLTRAPEGYAARREAALGLAAPHS